MNVILVIIENTILSYADCYRVYPDTEEGRKNAFEWAKQNGFESMWDIEFKKGIMSSYQCGPVKVGIMLQEVQEDSTQIKENNCKGCGKCCYKTIPFLDVEIMYNDAVPDIYVETREGGIGNILTRWMKRREDGSCIALDTKTNLCTIYEKRPTECRDFNQSHPLCKKLKGE